MSSVIPDLPDETAAVLILPSASGTILPRSTSYAPFSTSKSPAPPESTTPASLSTGSISGVRLRTLSI